MEGMLWPTTAPAPTFQGFGPSDYLGEEPRLHLLDAALGEREVRQRIRALCPTLPGVYGMLDSEEQLIYVGTSGNSPLRGPLHARGVPPTDRSSHGLFGWPKS